MIDLNALSKWFDDCTIVGKTVQAQNAKLLEQNAELKKLRDELTARERALAESQQLNESLRNDLGASRKNNQTLIDDNNRLTRELATERQLREAMEGHPEVKRAKLERARAAAAQAAASAAQAKQEAERLERELRSEPPAPAPPDARETD